MIPAVGIPTLPWAIRPGKLRPATGQPCKSFQTFSYRKPAIVLGLYLVLAIAALRLQCACWAYQAERLFCPPPPECTP